MPRTVGQDFANNQEQIRGYVERAGEIRAETAEAKRPHSPLQEAVRKGELENYIAFVGGQISGMIRKIKPAAQVVEEIVEQTTLVSEKLGEREVRRGEFREMLMVSHGK
jgi:hypothetical protein